MNEFRTGVMGDTVGEPVAAGFDEFGRVKAGALLPPAGTFADGVTN